MKHLTKKDYVTSTWSGGQTMQIAIAPEGAVYADRDFLWRLSSATVEREESDFTVLPNYDRLITPLDGSMRLVHAAQPGKVFALKPFEIHAFDGADNTHSEGRCTDFNLMLRKEACAGKITAILSTEQEFLPDPRTKELLLFCAKGDASVFYTEPGKALMKKIWLLEKETLFFESKDITFLKTVIHRGGCVLAAEIWRK